MSRTCELAGCTRTDATAHSACGTIYACPTCWTGIEQTTAELLEETRPPAYAKGDAVVWGGQTGAWIVQGMEDDETAWIHRPGVRMIPMVARPASGWIDLAPYRLEPEHAELVAVAELRPAVTTGGGA